jgi:hypothetical protein
MSTLGQVNSTASGSGYERRGEVVQIGALMPTILERYDLRFAPPTVAKVGSADRLSCCEATSNPSADGLPCV